MTPKIVIAAAALAAAGLWVLLGATTPGEPPAIRVISGVCTPAASTETTSAEKNSGASTAGSCINVNSAALQELTRLPGIGPVIADRIIEHRNRSGAFARVDDLLAVKGIGPARLKKIHDLVCF
jgi:competence protein ComEA